MSPVHTPIRIPSPESLTPPLSASDVERNIKDAVSIIVRLRKYVKELFPNLDVLPKVQYWDFFLIRSVVGGSRFRNPSGTSTVATRERWILNNLKVGATPVDHTARRTHLFFYVTIICSVKSNNYLQSVWHRKRSILNPFTLKSDQDRISNTSLQYQAGKWWE